ncbi:hypothetical protein CEP54_016377, partial [Fusarium duplospermum]
NGQVLPKPDDKARRQILEYLEKTKLQGFQKDDEGVYHRSLILAGRDGHFDGHLRLEFSPEASPVSGLIGSVTNIKEPYATPDPRDQYTHPPPEELSRPNTRPVLTSGGDVSSTNDTHQNGNEEASACELTATSNTLQGVENVSSAFKALPRARRGPKSILSQTQSTKRKKKSYAAVEGSCWP